MIGNVLQSLKKMVLLGLLPRKFNRQYFKTSSRGKSRGLLEMVWTYLLLQIWCLVAKPESEV